MDKERKTDLQKGGNGPQGRPHAVHYMTPFEEMERLFEGFMPTDWSRPIQWEWPRMARARMPFEGKLPNIDVVDRETEILLRAELPGVDKKDLDISVSDDSVTIKGSTKQESKEEKGDYYRCEITQGSFARTIALPCTVSSEKGKASFKDGMLELVLPKTAPAKRRSIKVE